MSRPAAPRRHVGWWLAAGGVVIAAALEIGLRLTPQFDPYGWLIWGRQTTHWALDPVGAPSWKPLPWLLATPLSLAGGAAPTLWVILACAGGLVALILAFRIAHALGGVIAGVVAVVGLVLCREWVALMVTGAIEPLTVALALGAAERHLAGRRRTAAVLLMLATLARPECGLLLAGYGAWLWFADPAARALLAGGAIAVAALWYLPPYIALGHGFSTSDPVFQSGVASHNPMTVAYRGATIVIWPVAVAGIIALVWAWRAPSWRSRPTFVLAAGGLAWVAATAVMAVADFPGIRRFMLPAAAAACILAGVGVSLVWERLRRYHGAWRIVALAAGAVVAVGAFTWYGRFRVSDAVDSVKQEQARSRLVRSLHSAIVDAGGATRLRGCGSPSAQFGLQSTIAWDLGVPVGVVGYRPHRDLRIRPHVVYFSMSRHPRLSAGEQLLGGAGPWRVIGVRARCQPARTA